MLTTINNHLLTQFWTHRLNNKRSEVLVAACLLTLCFQGVKKGCGTFG